MGEKQIEFLESILSGIAQSAGDDFTGLGLIIYRELQDLPVSGLRQSLPENISLPLNGMEAIKKNLLNLNNYHSFYHDGFHLLSSDCSLTHICQYFSPPVQQGISPDYSKGGRYRSAQYGSLLENVVATGIIGEAYGPFIFIKGETYKL